MARFETFDTLLNKAKKLFIEGNATEYNQAALELNEYIGWTALRYITISKDEDRNTRKKTKTTRKS